MKKINPKQTIEVQQKLKEIVVTQLKQQQKKCLKVNKRKKNTNLNVKLSKIDIIFFNGDKTKWNEFWDSYESKMKRTNNFQKYRNPIILRVN